MSRIDDIKRQNPNLNINLIDLIAEADPSDSYKYLGFLIKMLKENSSNNNMNILQHIFGEENLLELKKFDDHSKSNRVKVKDISLYNSFKQIKDEVRYADEIIRIKEMEKQTKILHKDDEWLVLIPLSYEASKLYGNGTKWCTTQEKYWNQYISDYKIIYIINRKNENIKYAISSKVEITLVEGWESNDDPISPFLIPIPSTLFSLITTELRDGLSIVKIGEYLGLNNRVTMISSGVDRDPILSDISTFYSGNTFDTIEYSFPSDGDYERLFNPEHVLEIFKRLKF